MATHSTGLERDVWSRVELAGGNSRRRRRRKLHPRWPATASSQFGGQSTHLSGHRPINSSIEPCRPRGGAGFGLGPSAATPTLWNRSSKTHPAQTRSMRRPLQATTIQLQLLRIPDLSRVVSRLVFHLVEALTKSSPQFKFPVTRTRGRRCSRRQARSLRACTMDRFSRQPATVAGNSTARHVTIHSRRSGIFR